MALVTAVSRAQFQAQEIPHAVGTAKKKKKSGQNTQTGIFTEEDNHDP